MYKKLSYIFSKRDKYKIALLLCIMVAGSFLELLGVAVFQPFVNIIMMPDSIQENPYLARIYQMFGCSTTESFLTVVALGIIVIYVVKCLSVGRAESDYEIHLWNAAETVYTSFNNLSVRAIYLSFK